MSCCLLTAILVDDQSKLEAVEDFCDLIWLIFLFFGYLIFLLFKQWPMLIAYSMF